METFYRNIFKKSWKIALHKQMLWILALFASFLGVAPTFQALFDLSPLDATGQLSIITITDGDFLTSNFIGWSNSFYQIPWSQVDATDIPILALLLLLLAIIIFILVIVIGSQGGLIVALDAVLKDKKTSYLESFRRGVDKFWELFIMQFIYRLFYILIFGAAITPIILFAYSMDPLTRIISLMIAYFVLIPILIILDIVIRYAVMYIMLENRNIPQSFDAAWKLFKKNWLISLETALAIFITLIVFATIILTLLWILIQLFIFFALSLPAGTIFFEISLFTGFIVLVLTFVVAIMIFTVFYLSMWTGVFRAISKGAQIPKIRRSLRHASWLDTRIG